MKYKLILTTLLAFGGMAYAQGIVSHLSIGAGFEGIFPASTFTRTAAEASVFNGNTQSTTTSVGAVADVRYDFGRHSALGAAVTINRNSELFFNGSGPILTRVQTNNAEIIGSYIFRLPANQRVKPYAMFGGGMVRFGPTNAFTTGGTPAAQMKPAFAYGFGTDLSVSEHLAVRLQYRGLLRAEPDFGLSSQPFGTALRAHVPEPSIQLVYHF